MTDIREKVARAICKHDALGLDPDEPQVHRIGSFGELAKRPAWKEHLTQAEAALSACGYDEMRKALESIALLSERDMHQASELRNIARAALKAGGS